MKTLFLLPLVWGIVSCVDKKMEMSDTPVEIHNMEVSLKKSETVDYDYETYCSFLPFWKRFRNSTIQDDTFALSNMTNFPFKIRGRAETEETKLYKKQDFLLVFHEFLQQPAHTNFSISEMEVIRNSETPASSCISGHSAKVGGLIFKYNGKDWRLSFAYFEYPTFVQIKKSENQASF